MTIPVRSKKNGLFSTMAAIIGLLDFHGGKWSGSHMTDGVFTDGVFPLTRRGLMAGLGCAILSPGMPAIAAATGRQAVTLQAKPGTAALRRGVGGTPRFCLFGAPTPAPLPF